MRDSWFLHEIYFCCDLRENLGVQKYDLFYRCGIKHLVVQDIATHIFLSLSTISAFSVTIKACRQASHLTYTNQCLLMHGVAMSAFYISCTYLQNMVEEFSNKQQLKPRVIIFHHDAVEDIFFHFSCLVFLFFLQFHIHQTSFAYILIS